MSIDQFETRSALTSLEKAKSIVRGLPAGGPISTIVVSKRRLRQAKAVELVRLKRESATPNLGFASRPFVLCGLPIKRPPKGALLHERRNGQFLLQVTGHPSFGVPWGQDRLVPIFLATLAIRQQKARITFRSAAEMLDVFGLQQGGTQYRRLIASFQRVFGATIFFGTDTQREKAAVLHQSRFNFMREARIWYSRDPNQETLPGSFENEIVLSDEFFREGRHTRSQLIWKQPKRYRRRPPPWISLCGSPIAASRQKAPSASQSLVTSAWPANSAALTTPGLANSVSGWSSGSDWCGCCGRNARLKFRVMAFTFSFNPQWR